MNKRIAPSMEKYNAEYKKRRIVFKDIEKTFKISKDWMHDVSECYNKYKGKVLIRKSEPTLIDKTVTLLAAL